MCWSWCCHGHITIHSCVTDCLSYRQYLQGLELQRSLQRMSWICLPQEAVCSPVAMLEMLSSRLQMAIRLTRLNETEIIHIVLFPLVKCHPVIQFCLFKIFLLLPSSLTQILSLILGLDNCLVDHCIVHCYTSEEAVPFLIGKKMLVEICRRYVFENELC